MSSPGLSYAYVDTRIRAMKGRLIPFSEYSRLVGMTLAEITHFLEDREYRKEIDELAPHYRGVDLVEYALAKNLASTFKHITHLVSGKGRIIVEAYLGKFDILNIKAIINLI